MSRWKMTLTVVKRKNIRILPAVFKIDSDDMEIVNQYMPRREQKWIETSRPAYWAQH